MNKHAAVWLHLMLFGAVTCAQIIIDTLPETGIYKSHQEFITGEPSVKIFYDKSTDSEKNRLLLYIQKKRFWYYNQQRNEYLSYKGEWWGYCDGKAFFINHKGKRYTLWIMPLYSTFVTDKKMNVSVSQWSKSDVPTEIPIFLPIGPVIARTTLSIPYQRGKFTPFVTCAVNMQTGGIIPLKEKSVESIISHDTELFQDFQRNKERAIMLETYIATFNERNSGK